MAKATIKTITPVHIGSGQILNKNIDFAQERDEIGFFDLDKIIKLIGIDQIDQLTNVIENNQSMLDYLRNGRRLQNSLSDFCKKISKVKNISPTTGQLKENYSTSLKGICIPGSSLKGSIKTAIWDQILTEQMLSNTNGQDLKNKKGKWSDKSLDSKLFGLNQTEKTTRFLKIRDIHFSQASTEIFEVIIINQHFHDWAIKEGNRFLVECIPSNSQSEFDFLIDTKMLEENKKRYRDIYSNLNTDYISDYKYLCTTINSFTKMILDWEIGDLEAKHFDDLDKGSVMLDKYSELIDLIDNLNAYEFIIRIGGNSGWRFTTGGWIEKEALNISDDDYNALKKSIQKRHYPNDVLLPKTRKTSSTGIPFGFVKITLPKDQ